MNSHSLNYFKNVEIENITNTEILQTVHDEISEILESLINHPELSYKFETLCKKSSKTQLLNILKFVDFSIIKTKLGSRIVELILNLLETSDYQFLQQKVFNSFLNYFLNQNSTFVLRKLLLTLDKEKLLSFQNDIQNVLGEIVEKPELLFTLQVYLQKTECYGLFGVLLKNHFLLDDLKTQKSRFYQFLIENCSKEDLCFVSKKVVQNFEELCADVNGNYVVQTLIERDTENLLIYYDLIAKNLSMFSKNSNVVFKLITQMLQQSNSENLEQGSDAPYCHISNPKNNVDNLNLPKNNLKSENTTSNSNTSVLDTNNSTSDSNNGISEKNLRDLKRENVIVDTNNSTLDSNNGISENNFDNSNPEEHFVKQNNHILNHERDTLIGNNSTSKFKTDISISDNATLNINKSHKPKNNQITHTNRLFKQKALHLIEKFYLKTNNDIFKSLCYKDTKLDLKFSQLVSTLLKNNHFDTLSLFKKHFQKSWLFSKPGRCLVKGYLFSLEKNSEKTKFVESLKGEFHRLQRNDHGSEIVALMSTFLPDSRGSNITQKFKRRPGFAKKPRFTRVMK